MNASVDINLERDYTPILEQYVVAQKSKALDSVYPKIAAEWHPTKNGKLLPSQISFRWSI